ncbi:hypothetical protein FRC07_004916 [Ceratobasidium sp. 392]|nr:hypothetical protein FRC07_004916 [Ceratobasidium sp. 392]
MQGSYGYPPSAGNANFFRKSSPIHRSQTTADIPSSRRTPIHRFHTTDEIPFSDSTHASPPNANFDVQSVIGAGVEAWDRFIHPNGERYWTYRWNNSVTVISDVQPPLTDVDQLIIAGIQQVSANPPPMDGWEIYVTESSYTYIHQRSGIASSDNSNFIQFRAMVERPASVTMDLRIRREYRYDRLAFCTLAPMTSPDRVLDDKSNAPFEKDNAREMFDLMQSLMDFGDRGPVGTHYYASVMCAIVYNRLYSYYGRSRAAKFREIARSEDLPESRAIFSPFEWFVWNTAGMLGFGSPFGFLKRINNVDRTTMEGGVSAVRWRLLLKDLCKEWESSNLLATVLVSATVAFLAIPGLSGLAHLAGLLSVVYSLSSVLFGTLLLSNHQSRIDMSSKDVAAYFDQAKHHGLGTTRPLAVLMSLPGSSMLWAMLWFIIAIASYAYGPGLPEISNKYTLWTRVVTIALILVLAFLGVLAVLFLHNIWGKRVEFVDVDQSQQGAPTETVTRSTPATSQPPPQNVEYVLLATVNPPSSAYYPYVQQPTPRNKAAPEYSTVRDGTIYSRATPLVNSREPHTPRDACFKAKEPAVLSAGDPIIQPQRELVSQPLTTGDATALSSGTTPLVSHVEPHVTRDTGSEEEKPAMPSISSSAIEPGVEAQEPSVSGTKSGRDESLDLIARYISSGHLQARPNPQRSPPFFNIVQCQGHPSSGLFIDFGLGPAFSASTPIPLGLHLLYCEPQLTLITSTGQTKLPVTPPNKPGWATQLQENLSYKSLVTRFRSTCEQYGPIESIPVPRYATHENSIATNFQVCIGLPHATDAGKESRGFTVDHTPVESCPLSVQLSTEIDAAAWRSSSQPTLPGVLSNVCEKSSEYEYAASTQVIEIDENSVASEPAPSASDHQSIGEAMPLHLPKVWLGSDTARLVSGAGNKEASTGKDHPAVGHISIDVGLDSPPFFQRLGG